MISNFNMSYKTEFFVFFTLTLYFVTIHLSDRSEVGAHSNVFYRITKIFQDFDFRIVDIVK